MLFESQKENPLSSEQAINQILFTKLNLQYESVACRR